jgi:hypothetical protein
MPLQPPSEFIKCTDITSCFQAIYNFLFAILIALAFLYFLYGAFEYLFSAAGVYPKERGKNKMKNSIIAVIIALVIPIFLNMINPGIFRVKLQIPKVNVESPLYVSLEAVEISERNLDTSKPEVEARFLSPTGGSRLGPILDDCIQIQKECDVKKIFKDIPLTNISFANNDNKTEYINPGLKNMIIQLDQGLERDRIKIKIIITDGFSIGDHASPCHTAYGTCIDVVVAGKPPTDPSWNKVIEIARSIGFWVLDERYIKGSRYSTSAHLHLEAR